MLTCHHSETSSSSEHQTHPGIGHSVPIGWGKRCTPGVPCRGTPRARHHIQAPKEGKPELEGKPIGRSWSVQLRRELGTCRTDRTGWFLHSGCSKTQATLGGVASGIHQPRSSARRGWRIGDTPWRRQQRRGHPEGRHGAQLWPGKARSTLQRGHHSGEDPPVGRPSQLRMAMQRGQRPKLRQQCSLTAWNAEPGETSGVGRRPGTAAALLAGRMDRAEGLRRGDLRWCSVAVSP